MDNPIVYFELDGPDGRVLRDFYSQVFDWSIDSSMTIAADSTGGTRGGIRQDPADKMLYIGVTDGSDPRVSKRVSIDIIAAAHLRKYLNGRLLNANANGNATRTST